MGVPKNTLRDNYNAKKDVKGQHGHEQTRWKPFKKTKKIDIEKDVEDLTSH